MKELTDTDKVLENVKCGKSFVYFLKYCRILEPPTQSNSGGIIPFQLWPHLKKAIHTLLNERLIVWLKSRQIGASWLMAAYVLWYELFKRGATSLLFSKGETEAIELLSKCRSIYTHLPDFLKLPMGANSATELSSPFMQSSIKALAATETAGVSFTASVIVCDEWILHPYASRNFLQAKPCIDAGGQFIGVFTIDKTRMSEIAVQTFVDAQAGRNKFAWLFDAYDARPGRDEEWYNDTKASIPESDLMGLTPELYMLSNYPRSVDEALRTIGTAAAFDHSSLDSMLENTKVPMSAEWYSANAPELDRNIVKIYQPFSLGQYYISSADTAHGVGRDYSVFGIMNVKSGGIVCDIMRNDLSPTEFAEHIWGVLKYYRKPKFFPEDNEWGRVVIEKLIGLEFKNWGYYDKRKEKIGWHTTKPSRDELFAKLIPAINNQQITVFNSSAISQLRDLIRNVDKGGRIEAAKGRNDDYAVMLGICWARRDEVSTEEWKPTVIESLHFARTR